MIRADYSDQPRLESLQNFGWAATVVDLNGDGYGDVCVGGYGSEFVPGRVYCVFGPYFIVPWLFSYLQFDRWRKISWRAAR